MRSYYSYIKTSDTYFDEASHATYKGITIKTSILIALTFVTGVLTAIYLPTILTNNLEAFLTVLIGAAIIGFVCVIIGRIFDGAAKICAPIYSVCEGLLLGTATAVVNLYYPYAGSICITATGIIFAIVFALYSCGIIRNFGKLRMIAFGIILSVLALSIFDVIFILSTGIEVYGLYIIIQIALLIYGVITLTFNFAEADAVVNYGASKDAEWSVSLGILVSVVYIYIYLLRILLYFMDRR